MSTVDREAIECGWWAKLRFVADYIDSGKAEWFCQHWKEDVFDGVTISRTGRLVRRFYDSGLGAMESASGTR